MIKIYNSLTNKLEEFKPIKEKTVMMYVCGSTVYNNMHIGNARPIVFFDVVSRFFQYVGYKVYLVSNFTDIDDKIIKKAQELGVTEKEVSEKYIKEILHTYRNLNCLPHYKNPKVTENIHEIIDFIQILVNNNSAYVVDGDVYFKVDSVEDYGILSGQTKENLLSGVRIETNDTKENSYDFNLWKKTNEGKKWESPWGMGRPGWHTECVVMINSIFNSKIDIHGGGIDLKFPHHDNEIAQAEAAFHHHLANYWMHNGRVDMQGEKMSKSLGNVVMADEAIERMGYQAFRLMMLNVPYRQPLNYREELVEQVTIEFDKIWRTNYSLFRKLQLDYNEVNYNCHITSEELLGLDDEFVAACADDFNTPNAITIIHKLVKSANNALRGKSMSLNLLKEYLCLLNKFLCVLGMDKKLEPLHDEDLEIVKKWQDAREKKDFTNADKYRELINQRGLII